LIVAVVFIAFASVVYSVWGLLPSEDRNFKVYPPWSLADAKGLSRYLNKYTVDYYGKVVAVYVVTYVFMQTFTVPGSLFLSLLAGSLFDTGTALLLVCSCAALGATCANRLSHYVGKELMEKYQAERLAKWRAQVDTQRGNLFNYMLFVRITPLIPNFFVNIAAPHVDVPLFTFFWGTFFGIMPPSILFIRMGSNLERLTAEDNTTSLPAQEMALLFLLGLLALAPIIFKDGVKKLTGVTI
jgi:uncharacterized membrane protein YdjX (TVP38/TMEM64 family)